MIRHANSEQAAISGTDLATLLPGWAEADHGTLPQQLAHGLRRSIEAGLLADGLRLPAERAVATALAVSRSTVTAALDELRAEGVVESRQGSGTRVRSNPTRAIGATRVGAHLSAVPGIDLAAGNPPDASHLPPLRMDVADLVAAGGPGVEPLGLPALRARLGERHRDQGLLTDPEQIHITAGAHQALALAIGAATVPGAAVAVDDPSYPGIFDILDTLGVQPVPVGADQAGLIPAELERVLADHQPAVLYLQAGVHNPTGTAPQPGRRRALAEICDRHELTVIEDCALADLVFAGRVFPELAGLCRRAAVISVGSLSKVAWGGLRIGWLRAPAPFVERTMNLRLGSDLGASVPAQLFALQLLDRLDELAAQRRGALAASVARAVELFRAELPDWRVTEPAGGSVLWPELPVSDTAAYVQLAKRHGVHVVPGTIATPTRGTNPHLRICVDRPWQLVEEAIRRLRLAWRELDTVPRPALG